MKYLSLFSGIEAASVAWAPLGWTPVAFAEIDPFACAVLAQRFPDVPNLGDVTRITAAQIGALGPIDVVIGGSPCQDLSIAGTRAGLAGERSILFHNQLMVFNDARRLGARWLVWENVPGALSSHAGRDFGRVVGAMAGLRDLDPPPRGWGTEGACVGPCGLVEWSVLDAQWFGLAQRRKRLFVVLDTGDWASRPPVLLEPESLRGDLAPSRSTGEGDARGDPPIVGAPRVANTLTARMAKGINTTMDEGQTLIPVVADPLTAHEARSYSHADNNPRLRNVVAGRVGITQNLALRRLTPLECERLQGFPDSWTDVTYRGRPARDTPRYRALGNSMAVPAIRWIGQSLARAHRYLPDEDEGS